MTEEMELRQWAVEAAIEAGAKEGAVLYYAAQFLDYVLALEERKHDAP